MPCPQNQMRKRELLNLLRRRWLPEISHFAPLTSDDRPLQRVYRMCIPAGLSNLSVSRYEERFLRSLQMAEVIPEVSSVTQFISR